MIGAERRQRIISLVNDNNTMSVPELMEALDASDSTVRRDLAILHREGLVRRVYGGVTKASSMEFVPADRTLESRKGLMEEEKRAVGSYAATLIGPDDFVFVDGGSTTAELVNAISETRATFFTNSLPLAQRLLARGCHVIVPGGEGSQLSEMLVGPETLEVVKRYRFTIGFWGTNGADPENGFTTPGYGEAAIKRASIQRCEHPYILTDSSKFKTVSLIKFAEFADATIICDSLAERRFREFGDIIEVGVRNTEGEAVE